MQYIYKMRLSAAGSLVRLHVRPSVSCLSRFERLPHVSVKPSCCSAALCTVLRKTLRISSDPRSSWWATSSEPAATVHGSLNLRRRRCLHFQRLHRPAASHWYRLGRPVENCSHLIHLLLMMILLKIFRNFFYILQKKLKLTKKA